MVIYYIFQSQFITNIFQVRKEGPKYNNCIMLCLSELSPTIASLCLSRALAFALIDVDEFCIDNGTEANLKKWMTAANHSMCSRSLNSARNSHEPISLGSLRMLAEF